MLPLYGEFLDAVLLHRRLVKCAALTALTALGAFAEPSGLSADDNVPGQTNSTRELTAS